MIAAQDEEWTFLCPENLYCFYYLLSNSSPRTSFITVYIGTHREAGFLLHQAGSGRASGEVHEQAMPTQYTITSHSQRSGAPDSVTRSKISAMEISPQGSVRSWLLTITPSDQKFLTVLLKLKPSPG